MKVNKSDSSGAATLILCPDAAAAQDMRAQLAAGPRLLRGAAVLESLRAPVEAAAGASPDTVIVDLRSSGTGSQRALSWVCAHLGAVPVIALIHDDQPSQSGQLEAAGADRVVAVGRDGATLAAELAHAVERIRKDRRRGQVRALNSRLDTIEQFTTDAIVDLDETGLVRDWNLAAERIFRTPKQQVLGQSVDAALPPNEPETFNWTDALALASKLGSGDFRKSGVELAPASDSKVTTTVRIRALTDSGGKLTGFTCLMTDHSETLERLADLQESYQELSRTQAELRALATQAESAREAEIERLARDVHDVLGYLLGGTKLDLRWALRRLADCGDAEVIEHLQQADATNESAIKAVRQIATSLRPIVLDRLGLVAALRDELSAFESRTGITVHSRLPSKWSPTRKVATTLYRVTQELLSNVAKHAQAKSLWVGIGVRDDGIWLTVQDDGCGIEPAAGDRPDALGLIGIRERLIAVRGTFHIERLDEGSTIANVFVPKRTVKRRTTP